MPYKIPSSCICGGKICLAICWALTGLHLHKLFSVWCKNNTCCSIITRAQNGVFKGGVHPVSCKILVFVTSHIPSEKCSLKSCSHVQLLYRAFGQSSFFFLPFFLTDFPFKQRVESCVPQVSAVYLNSSQQTSIVQNRVGFFCFGFICLFVCFPLRINVFSLGIRFR